MTCPIVRRPSQNGNCSCQNRALSPSVSLGLLKPRKQHLCATEMAVFVYFSPLPAVRIAAISLGCPPGKWWIINHITSGFISLTVVTENFYSTTTTLILVDRLVWNTTNKVKIKMCSKVMNYKAYQQVLDLAGEKKRITKTRISLATAPKKRTKSGCLTCRKRKKKCDEEKVGGKCQACIRNFLDCCWPGDAPKTQEEEVKTVKVEVVSSPSRGASAYPSPMMSPKSETGDDCKDIMPLALPESKYKVMKVTKPATKKSSKKGPNHFIVTSFDLDRALCQVKVWTETGVSNLGAASAAIFIRV